MRKAIWITGVPASGKTVLAERLVTAMKKEFGAPCAVVDANVIRKQFWPHLGLSPEDRVVNVNGMAELAGVFVRAGNDVVVACIAPERSVRNRALGLIRVSAEKVAVYQIHLHAPRETLEARDTKGLYQAFNAGKLAGLTGVDAPYEPPSPKEALYLDTSKLTVGDALQEVIRYVKEVAPRPWPDV